LSRVRDFARSAIKTSAHDRSVHAAAACMHAIHGHRGFSSCACKCFERASPAKYHDYQSRLRPLGSKAQRSHANASMNTHQSSLVTSLNPCSHRVGWLAGWEHQHNQRQCHVLAHGALQTSSQHLLSCHNSAHVCIESHVWPQGHSLL
jgi:hypothetical protein